MNKVDPKRATVFIFVFTVLALLITSFWQHLQQLPTQRQRPSALQTGRERQRPSQVEIERQTTATTVAREQAVNQGQEEALSQERQLRQNAAEAAAEHTRYLARYLNSDFSRKPGKKMVAIVVVSEDGNFNHAVITAIANRLSTESVGMLTSFFRPPFVTDGLFNNVLAGSNGVFDKLELSKSLDMLLLGRQEVRYSTNPSLENVITANMRLEITAFSITDAQSQSWTFVANGAGFKQTEARLMAEERLIKQIAGDTKMSLSF